MACSDEQKGQIRDALEDSGGTGDIGGGDESAPEPAPEPAPETPDDGPVSWREGNRARRLWPRPRCR